MTTPREFIPIPGMQRTAPRRYETVAPRYAPVAEGLIGTGMRVPPELQTLAEEIGGRGTRIKDANLFSLFVKESAIEFNKFDLNTFMGQSDFPLRQGFAEKIQNPATVEDRNFASIANKRGIEEAYDTYLGLVTQSQPEELKVLLGEHPTKWPDLLGGAEWGERLESPYVGLGSEGYLDPETGKFDVLRKNLDREKLLEGPQRPERLAERIIGAGATRGTVPLLATMLQGYAAAAGPVSYILGTIGGEVARAKAREANWPGWAQGTAQVVGSALGGVAGVIPEEQAIRGLANWTRSLTPRGPSFPMAGMPIRERWGVSGAGTKMSPTELAERQFFASQSPDVRAALTQAAQEGFDPSQRIVAGGARRVVPEVADEFNKTRQNLFNALPDATEEEVEGIIQQAVRIVDENPLMVDMPEARPGVQQAEFNLLRNDFIDIEARRIGAGKAIDDYEPPVSETFDATQTRAPVGEVVEEAPRVARAGDVVTSDKMIEDGKKLSQYMYRTGRDRKLTSPQSSENIRALQTVRFTLRNEKKGVIGVPSSPDAPSPGAEMRALSVFKENTGLSDEFSSWATKAGLSNVDSQYARDALWLYEAKRIGLDPDDLIRKYPDSFTAAAPDAPTAPTVARAGDVSETVRSLRVQPAEELFHGSSSGALDEVLDARPRDIVGIENPEGPGFFVGIREAAERFASRSTLPGLPKPTSPNIQRVTLSPDVVLLTAERAFGDSLPEIQDAFIRASSDRFGASSIGHRANVDRITSWTPEVSFNTVSTESLSLQAVLADALRNLGADGLARADGNVAQITNAKALQRQGALSLTQAPAVARPPEPSVTQPVMQPVMQPVERFQLPRELARSQVNYGRKAVEFESDLDRALYIATSKSGAKTPSKRRLEFEDLVREQLGLGEDVDLGEVAAPLRARVKELAGQFDDTIEVPRFTEEPGVTLPAVAATGVDGFPITPKNVVAVSGKGGARFVVKKEPEVSLSQLQYMQDLAAGREAAKVISGKVPPRKRSPGDPVGYNPNDPPPARPDIGIADILDNIPVDEVPSKAVMRKLEGARNAAQLKIEVWFTDGMTLMKQLGIRIPDRESMLPIFRAMEGEISVDDLDPSLLPFFNHIKKFKDLEETDHLNFLNENIRVSSIFKEQDPENALALSLERTALDSEAFIARMSAHPDYMPRAWDVPGVTSKIGVIPRLIAGVIRKERPKFGRRASFQKPRIKATFSELLEWAESQGGSVASWNPMYAMAMRVLQGVEYREQIKLLNRLRVLGRVVPENEMPADGWRVPRNVGGGFEGRPIATTKSGDVVLTPRLAVENHMADFLEEIYGIQPFDGANTIRKWSDRLKTNILMFSGFQHIDISTRALGTGVSPTAIMRGGPLKLPSLAYRIIRASTQAGYRQKTAKKFTSNQVLYKDKDFVITHGMLVEEGTGIHGDISIVERSLMSQLNKTAAMRGLGRGFEPLVKLKQGFETGLFSGIYREAQIFALQNHIIPWLRRTNPGYNATQIAAAASREANIMFSSLGRWQTVLTNPTFRRITNLTFFSTNEAESLLSGFRKAISLPGTRNAGLYREWYAGMFIGIAFIANLINLASKQRPLSPGQYNPIDFNDPYSPFGWGYNDRFLSPVIPFVKGRNGEDIYLDLVGQMDTAFRLLDPINFLTARYNLAPRALYNQVRAKSFFGEPLDTPQKKAGQLVSDLFIPISAKGPVEMLVEQERIPSAVTKIIDIPPGGEKALGTLTSFVQGFGLNMRPETKSQTMLRSAQKLHPEIETLEELDPLQRYELRKNDPSLAAALRVKEEDAARRGSPYAKYKILREDLEKEKIAREAELLLKLQHTYASRKYPDESKYEAGSAKDIFLAWYAEYKSLQAEMFARMEGMRQGLGIDSYSGREARTPNEKILNEYYALQDEAKTPAGGFDTDKWVELRDSFFETLTEDKKEFIDKWRSRHEHAPGVEDLLKLFGHRVWFGTRWRIYHPQIIDILNKIERSELQDLIAQVQPSPESR